MATHSSILAWEIAWTEELGGLQSMGSPRVRYDWAWTHTADVERTMWKLGEDSKVHWRSPQRCNYETKASRVENLSPGRLMLPPCSPASPVSWRSFRRAGTRTQLSWVNLPCSLQSPPQRIINSCSSLARICRMPLTYFLAFFMGACGKSDLAEVVEILEDSNDIHPLGRNAGVFRREWVDGDRWAEMQSLPRMLLSLKWKSNGPKGKVPKEACLKPWSEAPSAS